MSTKKKTVAELEKELAVAKALAKEKLTDLKNLEAKNIELRTKIGVLEKRVTSLVDDIRFYKSDNQVANAQLEKANGYIAALIEGTDRKGPFHEVYPCRSCGKS